VWGFVLGDAGEDFDFAGHVTGFDQAELGDRQRLRAELGYRPHERVCLVTVGGSGVGASLLRRVMEAFPPRGTHPRAADDRRCGAAYRPGNPAGADGLEVRAFVEDLYRHLAACDLAVVQGGLTTAMELTAAGRPFLYFPLRHHFERASTSPTGSTATEPAGGWTSRTPPLTSSPGRSPRRSGDYRPVETDGARLAARCIAELLD
jgi:UDP:flavonoid glycosyltransferase YjiC (YdhE family)